MNEGYYKVKFMVNATGAIVEKSFNTYNGCFSFVNKLRHSKKCTLISHPIYQG